MDLKEFKFSEQDVKKDFTRSENLYKKINFAFNYLSKHLPINHLSKDNTFDFDNIKFDEGKNYDWFFLNGENVSILIRQYSTHFTFFAKNIGEHEFLSRTSVFTICDNTDKMTDDVSDSFIDDNYQSISKYLPRLIELIKKDKIWSIWNNYSLEREDYTEVKIAMDGKESVSSLDTLIFACDELFSKYVATYAENDVLEIIKGFKVGDTYDEAYTITRVNTDLKDDYYHSCGLELKNNNFPDSEPRWADVYSLAMFYQDGLNPTGKAFKRDVMNFVYKNHGNVLNKLIEIKDEPFLWMKLDFKYKDFMLDLYLKANKGLSEEDIKQDFYNAITKEHLNFVTISFKIEFLKLS